MSAKGSLAAELRVEVKHLEDDLRTRVAHQSEVDSAWRAQHREALERGRTAASWQEWSDERVTQAAVAWVLATVFIRFAEDNGLVKPVWISGRRQRRVEALNGQAEFLREEARTNPDVTDREWLQRAISYLASLPATRALMDESSALWLVTPSGDAATRLLEFWRERDETGELIRDLADDTLDTRFLGDLYQQLSKEAQDRYALRQTPAFVEEFILDRTLEPALRERHLEDFRMIDPTCGSGHFLLGAFARLLDRWHRQAPDLDSRARVQKALDAIHGVDINPFAVAIARFRLTIAALRASGDRLLEEAPAFKYHLAVGDSLLHGLDQQEFDLAVELSVDRTAASFTYATENLADLQAILLNGHYDVVVGNPPYIQVSDRAVKAQYRNRYPSCYKSFALSVPFTERFFALAKSGDRPGWVGQITSNSFMKRDFGRPLIEKFLPTKDLMLIADTSGAYIPGHNREGTPTAILVGRNCRPSSSTVRAVLRGRGEIGKPEDPAKGTVWASIVEHVDKPGHSDEWVTIADLDRKLLAAHPWSLAGGGAVELAQALEGAARSQLADVVSEIGFGAVTREDSAFMVGAGTLRRTRVDDHHQRPIVEGNVTRDWRIEDPVVSAWPYDPDSLTPEPDDGLQRLLWPYRSQLSRRVAYGKTQVARGLPWFAYSMFFANRYRTTLSIAYAFKASHNHFVLDRGGKVFKQTAPVIKLPEGTSKDGHLGLIGVLNASTVLFWLRENAQHQGGGAAAHSWSWTYEFSGGIVERIPLPKTLPLERSRSLDTLAQRLSELTPAAVCSDGVPTRQALDATRDAYHRVRADMVAQQEELDWEVYRLYGVVTEDLTYSGGNPPGLTPAERAFAIVLARGVGPGEEELAWFTHQAHRFVPVTEIPVHWPQDYRDLVTRRIELIESHPYFSLLERPECKRRWESEAWETQEERALRSWLLDRLEDQRFWFDRAGRPTPRSVAQLADDVARHPDLVSVLGLWEGRPDVPVATSLQRLLAAEVVPFLAAYRYTESGLRKRAAWEHTWALQRREDAGEKVGEIPVPPEYKFQNKDRDFTRKEYWTHRGKLDVPKERFILYPDAGRDTDPTPVLGWAGWDHAQQALALDQLIQQREAEGWDDERLVPLVAGLAELLPWVEQWHADPDLFYGGVSPAEFFREQLEDRARQVERTRDQLAAWRSISVRRGRARKAATP